MARRAAKVRFLARASPHSLPLKEVTPKIPTVRNEKIDAKLNKNCLSLDKNLVTLSVFRLLFTLLRPFGCPEVE